MKVLLICPKSQTNGYITNLFNFLSNSAELKKIEIGIEPLWTKEYCYDIYHFQWPEGIFDWKEPTQTELDELSRRIDEIKLFAKIVSTVHNEAPHYRDTKNYKELYKIIYSNSDSIIHLGKYSKNKYEIMYPNSKSIIIPHGIYSNFPNSISKIEAKKKLGIKLQDIVFICIGNIRAREESDLLLKIFNGLKIKNKKLIVLRGILLWDKLKLQRIIKRIIIILKNRIIWVRNYIPDNEMEIYLNAADILIIPRIAPLNSGNLILGYTFGRVVIGPDYGNVGEILNETSNPTFDPKKISTAVEAANKAIDLNYAGKGKENKHFAEEKWNWRLITKEHINIYKQLLDEN